MERLKQTAISMLRLIWRQKFVIGAAILFFIGVCIVVSKTAETTSPPDYTDDFLIAKLSEEDKSNYNNENTSMFDPGLLKETRERWIVSRHNASMPYNLEQPAVMDPSMGQAEKINGIFKNMTNGFFIECGAFDGETRSNTLYFERYLNWTGLLIEADPVNFHRITQKNRRAYLSNTCLSTKKYPMTGYFLMANNIGRLHMPHEPSDGDDDLENTPDVAHHGEHVEVQCLPLATYIAALNIESVEYLSLDIEGLELDVLETIPFDTVNIKALSVEYIHDKKSLEEMTTLMEKQGYEVDDFVIRDDNLANDVIFVKKGLKISPK
ncbi:uncharacterized protein LOC105693518 isoform X2 [Athalia rosae]|uniref:uncharacterized protein LOC105693518 isoform X2 n=1 Tax=Athalia rosae TaxID=37344 RepID=UPI00203426EC|nr:uncharacterized protein LOC105693518 isoform X2 [Athalia rosae]